jgi:uncharacterized membrane protein YfcA
MDLSGLQSITTQLPPTAIVATAVALLVAAVLRGFTGFGFALVAVPLTSLTLSPARSVPMIFLLQMVLGGFDTLRHFRHFERSIGAMAATAILTTPVGVYLLSIASPVVARLTIAGMMLAGAALMWRPLSVHLRPGYAVGGFAGIGVGLSNGLAAMPGPPAIAYSLLTNLPPDRARVSMMVLFFITALAGVPSAFAFGIADNSTLILAAAALPIILAGSRLGELLFRRFGSATYRQVALLTLMGAALAMIGRELWGLYTLG